MYKYETHCHTNVASACSKLSPQDIVDFYIENGYTGVFITDHFLNGNCSYELRDEEKPYADRVKGYCEGYRQVKECAKGKLDVFFGFEYSYKGTDVLVYGISPKQLMKMPEIMTMTMREFVEYVKEKGGIAIQAHPYREAGYIDHIRIFPTCEGVEVYNSSRDKRCNDLAVFFAKQYNKPVIGGSDIHYRHLQNLSGMKFDTKIINEQDFIEKVRSGEGKIIKQKNKWLKNHQGE